MSIQPVMRKDERTRAERQLARALLLSATMHLLHQEREHALKMGNYTGAEYQDRKIFKRNEKIWEVLDKHYYLR